MTLKVETLDHPHDQWLEPRDRLQGRYERARMAALASHPRLPSVPDEMLRAHGMAGVFLEPERTLLRARSPSRQRRHHTAFHHTHLPEDLFASIACSLAEGVGVNSTGRIFEVGKKTVLAVLARAADHADAVARSLLKDVSVAECQLDELWSFIGKKERNLAPLEALSGIFGDAWIWIAFDTRHKLVLARVVGKRTTAHAILLLQEVQRVAPSMPLLFSSDDLDAYPHALLHVYGRPWTPPRRPGPGRPPKPRLRPPDDLCYVQVVKRYERSRVADVRRRIVFGDPDRIERLLQESPGSETINTAYVERNNATIRHLDARCNRKTYRFSKCKKNHERQLALSLAYYHLCRPHRTLTTEHRKPTTPFMAARLTDHPWSMHELLGHYLNPACP